ncbi:hypothetical protein QYE76_052408 [Lolium multiflorum]|uniref:CCHC-type domain-containing protein n=1 Tax=Lolium multiflorum TaxID=4521 RepID=A0AAD8SUN3_LOLMU|nr:hypothetical protein QYE76_052408 [Lolium multiflorum]
MQEKRLSLLDGFREVGAGGTPARYRLGSSGLLPAPHLQRLALPRARTHTGGSALLAEEIKELKAQVTSLKNDLVKGHEGKCKLDTMLSMQQSPNDKSGLGFKSNNKNKPKNNNKKKGQYKSKTAKIVCFKCNIEGHHVRSCPLKKKQKGSGLKLKLIFNLKLKKTTSQEETSQCSHCGET